jgi:hypothetical protein
MTDWFARPVFHVKDVDASLPFYVNLLGFTSPWRYDEEGRERVAQVDRPGCALILANNLAPEKIGKGAMFISLNVEPATPEALRADGSVWAWGFNREGELGFDTSHSTCVGVSPGYPCSATPGKTMMDIGGPGPQPITGAKAIAAGGSHGLALLNTGTLVSWGFNYYGQLGNGANTDQQVAGVVVTITPNGGALLGPVKFIVAGGAHSLAVKTDGTVWAWGLNSSGQLSDGTLTDRNTAVAAINQSGVRLGATSISAGDASSFAGALSMVADSAALTFPAQTVGSRSPSLTVTILNNSGGPLASISAKVTGFEQTDFGVTATSCQGPLPPLAGCTVSVGFSPTNTGIRTATLYILSDAVASPLTVVLKGVGQ